MTTSAVGSKFAIVHVARAMAVTTASAGGLHFLQRVSVAIVAGDLNMSTRQRKIRLLVVIKQPLVPGNRVVAGITLFVEISAMRIVLNMAGNTGGIRLAKGLRFMAVDTFHLAMGTEQREWAKVVVEKQWVLPVDFRMAVLALHAQRLVMRVIIDMTGLASRLQ